MLKHLTIAVLLILTLAQAFSKAVTVLGFTLNQDYIAANLCEKKDDVKSCCKGKCHLAKQLAEDDSTDNNSSDKGGLKLHVEDLYVLNTSTTFALQTSTHHLSLVAVGFSAAQGYTYLPAANIAHPPAA